MPSFRSVLLQILPRTQDVSSFRFSNPLNIIHSAGQYMMVTITSGSAKITHTFSISSSPTEKGYLELTTRLRVSEYKNTLRKMKPGDSAQIEAPFGTFTLDKNSTAVGMLAGGIGITPFRSIMKYCTDTQASTKVTLIYGVRSQTDVVFKQDFDDMQKQNANLKVVYVLQTAPKDFNGYAGFINAEVIQKEIPDYKSTIFYVCGTPSMVKAMQNLLLTVGVPAVKVRIENFGGYQTGVIAGGQPSASA